MTTKGKAVKTSSKRGPHGRPETEVAALARQYTPAAILKLAELMNDPNSCVKVAAAQALLDRAHGKVSTSHSHKADPVRKKPARDVNVNIKSFNKKGDGDAERV
jgi:hypothetical protein